MSAVGNIRYLADVTRYEIEFASNSLARWIKNPKKKYFELLKHLLIYLKVTDRPGLIIVQ